MSVKSGEVEDICAQAGPRVVREKKGGILLLEVGDGQRNCLWQLVFNSKINSCNPRHQSFQKTVNGDAEIQDPSLWKE